LGNTCYHSAENRVPSRNIRKEKKIKLYYNTVIYLLLCMHVKREENVLRLFLRGTSGPQI